jgi:glycine hydroxymethyltransferase
VIVEKQDPAIVRNDVADFRKQFQKVHYAFDNAVGAYEYISLIGDGKKMIQ